jgi:CheY-like chemotaxis protein
MIFEQTPFNLSTSINDTLHLFKIKIQEKNLELVSEYDETIPDVLIGDPLRLRQIILNLVGNAVKFTAQGKIGVHIRRLSENARKVSVEFTVVDTGIGIHENKLEHIFDDFEQASYENSKIYGGTGLGLAIVKKLVELQGGKLIVKSKFGEGSTFGFVLDFGKTLVKAEKKADMEIKLDVLTKKVKVLVVEDMPLNQLLIKILLSDFGFEFDIVSNGKFAIEKLSQKDADGIPNKYDVILMDLQMPEMDGFEATAYIRNKLNSSVPIIALTADVTSIDIEKSKSFGMDDYISKPIDEKLLYNKIMTYIKKT